MKKTFQRLLVTALTLMPITMTVFFYFQTKVHSDEVRSPIVNPSQDCTRDKDTQAAQEAIETGQALENPSLATNGSNISSESEMLSPAQVAVIPDEALETIDRINQSRSDLVDENVGIVRQLRNEAILERAAVEVQTMTPEGVVSCDVTDNFIDTIVSPEEPLIFIGGPQDNQPE
jgi:hypothetical protein